MDSYPDSYPDRHGEGNIEADRFTMVSSPLTGTSTAGIPTSTLLSYSLIRVGGVSGIVPTGATITRTPSLPSGLGDGRTLIIVGTDDAAPVTFRDQSNLSGSKLNLAGGNDFEVGAGDSIMLVYDATRDVWDEISRSNN